MNANDSDNPSPEPSRPEPAPFDSEAFRPALREALDRAFQNLASNVPWIDPSGSGLREEFREKLIDFGTLLADKARLFNLTRLTSPDDMAVLHFLDTHFLAAALDRQVRTVIDIGTGAGIPGLPLAILRPKLEVTLIDGTSKKVAFVDECIQMLGLKKARAVHGRIEEHLRKRGLRYHAGVLRAAVKPANMLEILKQCRSPLDQAVFMLGSEGRVIARSAAEKSGRYKPISLVPYNLPGQEKIRFIAAFRKKKKRAR